MRRQKPNKKDLLFLSNSLMALFLLACMIYEWAAHNNQLDIILLRYVLIQCVFTFLTLIIYYVARFVDAKEREKTDGERISHQSEKSDFAVFSDANTEEKKIPPKDEPICMSEEKISPVSVWIVVVAAVFTMIFCCLVRFTA